MGDRERWLIKCTISILDSGQKDKHHVTQVHTHLSRLIVHFGDQHTVVLARGNADKVLDCLGILLTGGSVPEYDTVLNFFRLPKRVDQCVREVAPLIVVANVGKVDE